MFEKGYRFFSAPLTLIYFWTISYLLPPNYKIPYIIVLKSFCVFELPHLFYYCTINHTILPFFSQNLHIFLFSVYFMTLGKLFFWNTILQTIKLFFILKNYFYKLPSYSIVLENHFCDIISHLRACLKNAFCKMYVAICGRFRLNEGGVANLMKDKSTEQFWHFYNG